MRRERLCTGTGGYRMIQNQANHNLAECEIKCIKISCMYQISKETTSNPWIFPNFFPKRTHYKLVKTFDVLARFLPKEF